MRTTQWLLKYSLNYSWHYSRAVCMRVCVVLQHTATHCNALQHSTKGSLRGTGCFEWFHTATLWIKIHCKQSVCTIYIICTVHNNVRVTHITHKSIWINKSSVNPKSTSNQSSKPCTVLQYPSRKVYIKYTLHHNVSRNTQWRVLWVFSLKYIVRQITLQRICMYYIHHMYTRS